MAVKAITALSQGLWEKSAGLSKSEPRSQGGRGVVRIVRIALISALFYLEGGTFLRLGWSLSLV